MLCLSNNFKSILNWLHNPPPTMLCFHCIHYAERCSIHIMHKYSPRHSLTTCYQSRLLPFYFSPGPCNNLHPSQLDLESSPYYTVATSFPAHSLYHRFHSLAPSIPYILLTTFYFNHQNLIVNMSTPGPSAPIGPDYKDENPQATYVWHLYSNNPSTRCSLCSCSTDTSNHLMHFIGSRLLSITIMSTFCIRHRN